MIETVFPKAPPGAVVFRPGAARFAGYAWLLFTAANLIDLIWRGRDAESLVAAAVLLLGCGVAYAIALRPRIVADEHAVRLHNVLRDVHVPWAAVERVEGGDAVYVHTEARRFRAFVLQTSPRGRARFEARARRDEKKLPDAVTEYVRGRTPTDFAVEQLRELAERSRATAAGRARGEEDATAGMPAAPADPVVRWALPAIVALAVPGVALVIALVIALA